MNVLWDDLVDELVRTVQDKVVPRLEQVSKQAAGRWKQQQQQIARRPPRTTDLVYLTDRLIVSSQPASAWPTPEYADVGRDERRPWRKKEQDEEDDEGGESSQGQQLQQQQQGSGETLSQVPELSSSEEESSCNPKTNAKETLENPGEHHRRHHQHYHCLPQSALLQPQKILRREQR